MGKDSGVFGNIRDLVNSTVNEPKFNLRNWWTRGGAKRILREAFIISLIIVCKIFIYKKFIQSSFGIKAFSALSFLIGLLHLFMISLSIGSHIRSDGEGWKWVKWSDYTGEICYEKYYPPITIISASRFKKSNRGPRWERGLKWHMWYALLNCLIHTTRGLFILFI